jgi:hypothetical protein
MFCQSGLISCHNQVLFHLLIVSLQFIGQDNANNQMTLIKIIILKI